MRAEPMIGALLAFLVATLPGCALEHWAEHETIAERLVESCHEQTEARRYTTAVRMCTEAVHLAPSTPLAYYYRAESYAHLREYRQAISDLDVAIRDNPRSWDALQARASMYLGLHDYDAALKDADSLVALEPRYEGGHEIKCEIYDRKGDYPNARRECDLAEKAPMDRVYGYMHRSYLAATHADWQRALRDASQAISMLPSSAEAWNNRCWIRIRMNDVAGATSDCATALKLSRDNPHIRDTRADIFIRERKYAAVIEDENAMIAWAPEAPYGYGGRCAAETQEQRLDAAMRDCTRAVALNNPYDGDWFILRGNVYRALGQMAKAQADYRRAERGEPLPIQVFREEAQLALDERRFSDAARLAQEYVGLNPYDPVGHDVLGRALARLGETSKALDQLDIALTGYAKRADSVSIAQIKAMQAGVR